MSLPRWSCTYPAGTLAQAETERLARAEGAARPRDLMSANREDEESMMVCVVYENMESRVNYQYPSRFNR
jgi:hypothetical protein